MKDFIKAYFSYSPSQRNGILVLLILITIVLGIRFSLPHWAGKDNTEYDFTVFEQEIEAFEADTLINLNTATVEDLENLPGVGPAYAEKIIEYREELGQFDSIPQLLDVNGIGPATLYKINPYITLD